MYIRATEKYYISKIRGKDTIRMRWGEHATRMEEINIQHFRRTPETEETSRKIEGKTGKYLKES
jgi:hypothetical protein